MKIGDKIRLTQETINEFNVPEDVHEGVVVNFSINQHGAFVKHTNGMVYAWDFSEFEVIRDGDCDES